MAAPSAVSAPSCYVDGRLAKLEATLAETQAELVALKRIKETETTNDEGALKSTAAGDEEDAVAMAVHLGLNVSSVKEMSAQQRWLVSACFTLQPNIACR